jgi:hypothetical protein
MDIDLHYLREGLEGYYILPSIAIERYLHELFQFLIKFFPILQNKNTMFRN